MVFQTAVRRMATTPKDKSSKLMKHWFAVEAIPMYVIIGGVVAGASWYLTRLASGPSVIWTKANPTPWNTIQPDQGTKMMSVNQKFEKSWSRDKL